MIFWFCIMVSIHLESDINEVLIDDASFCVIPTALVFDDRSMPARSQKLNLK